MRSEDRISNLPNVVIDAILIRMPLRDAVRTSILSHAWRYKWSTLPDLKFDWTDFSLCDDVLSHNNYDKQLVQMVDQVLLLHQGPINRFVLSTYSKNHKAMDRWILFLSRNDIREFILQSRLMGLFYKVPSYLFSCDKITYLELCRCRMNPPALFDGFKNLRTLILSSVILSYSLEKLISNSPSLNKLTLRYILGCYHLKICAPNLVYLNVQGSFRYLCFEETPVLADVSISLPGDYACKSNHILGCLPSIKRLELLDKTFKILSASAGHVPVMLASKCELKYLKACINFEDTQQMLAALCIFRSSPFLQWVDIVSYSKIEEVVSAYGFSRGEENLPCFSQLQILNMRRFKGTASELKFVEFVLANAPVLEMLKFEFGSNKANVMKIVGELLRFRRASSSAEIVIPELGFLKN